jgi:predicted Zn-dependent protease with MMP-like domain
VVLKGFGVDLKLFLEIFEVPRGARERGTTERVKIAPKWRSCNELLFFFCTTFTQSGLFTNFEDQAKVFKATTDDTDENGILSVLFVPSVVKAPMRFPQLLQRTARVVNRTQRALPTPLRTPAAALPVIYERAPGPESEADGMDEDTLGLFIGPAHGQDPGLDPLPAQIILYLDNIWDYAEGDAAAYDEEVRTTYLHELGHYLRLDEGDLERRGLG